MVFVAHARIVYSSGPSRNQRPLLSLMSALRVNWGTAQTKKTARRRSLCGADRSCVIRPREALVRSASVGSLVKLRSDHGVRVAMSSAVLLESRNERLLLRQKCLEVLLRHVHHRCRGMDRLRQNDLCHFSSALLCGPLSSALFGILLRREARKLTPLLTPRLS